MSKQPINPSTRCFLLCKKYPDFHHLYAKFTGKWAEGRYTLYLEAFYTWHD